jgi:secretion/DNA translocation related TadE-like protein
VLVALGILVLALLAASGVVLGSVLAARTQLSTATDLATLAGASATLFDPAQACTRARNVARANGAELTGCHHEGTEVWVTARAPIPGAGGWVVPGGGPHFLRARAHAQLGAAPGSGAW